MFLVKAWIYGARERAQPLPSEAKRFFWLLYRKSADDGSESYAK